MTNPSDLGTLLASLREQRNFSCRALAQRARVSPTTIGNWESGASVPRLPELLQVLEALEASAAAQQQAIQLLQRPRALVHLRRNFREAPTNTFAPLPLCQGDLLRALRARRGWTLEQLAVQLGVATRTVSRWERGEVQTSIAQRHAFCQALAASSDEITLLTLGCFAESTERPLNLGELDALFETLWRPQHTPYKAALMELGYLSVAVRLQSSGADTGTHKKLLLQTYAALADRYYVMHQYDRAAAFAGQAIRLLSTFEKLPGFGVVALVRFAETSHHHALSSQLLAQWLPRVHEPAWQAWLLSQMAAVMAIRRRPVEADALSLKSLELVKDADRGEQEGRRLDRAELLRKLNQPEKSQEFLPTLNPEVLAMPHLTLPWAKNQLALGQFPQAANLVERTQRSLDVMENDWAHMTPLIRRPTEALSRTISATMRG
ncbi:helix-turn-helix transcriptional regulator [Armatimonas sp.]|uniref:helix-turn-helix domain-containing protein n=1 Tax=Armatimonas sp. TaxID=1872638 RepID=UPI00286C2885|nr:helix-turn-helix transcriptional regulator [Armatimonas sp.]